MKCDNCGKQALLEQTVSGRAREGCPHESPCQSHANCETPMLKQCAKKWKTRAEKTLHVCGRPKGHKRACACRRLVLSTGKRCRSVKTFVKGKCK